MEGAEGVRKTDLSHAALEVDVLDESSGAQGTLDVPDPRALEEAVMHRAGLASSPRNKSKDERGDLGDLSTIDTVVTPKPTRAFIAECPSGRCTEDGRDGGVMRDVQVAPWARRVCVLEP